MTVSVAVYSTCGTYYCTIVLNATALHRCSIAEKTRKSTEKVQVSQGSGKMVHTTQSKLAAAAGDPGFVFYPAVIARPHNPAAGRSL